MEEKIAVASYRSLCSKLLNGKGREEKKITWLLIKMTSLAKDDLAQLLLNPSLDPLNLDDETLEQITFSFVSSQQIDKYETFLPSALEISK